MSVGLYDKAIVNKLRLWLTDAKINVSNPDTLFSYRADASETDDVKLPLVSLNRGQITIVRSGKLPASKEGFKIAANEEKVTTLRTIPITIKYQLDIYTRFRKESDDLTRELIFKLINNPKLQVEIPYENSDNTHYFTMTLDDDIEDNSDVAQHVEKGEYYRVTLNISVMDAYLFDYRAKDTLSLKVAVDENNE